MIKKTILHVIFILLILTSDILITAVVAVQPEEKNNHLSDEYLFCKPHRPIYITSNNDLNRWNGVTSGDGTKENPYVISGWRISGVGRFFHDIMRDYTLVLGVYFWFLFPDIQAGITIMNVDKYVVVEENKIVNWKDPYLFLQPCHQGVIIENCSNIVIKNNSIRNCDEGITVDSNTRIVGNRFSKIDCVFKMTGEVIDITGSNVTVENNYFEDCQKNSGISFLYADGDIMICNNTLKDIGDYTIIGYDAVIKNNTLENCRSGIHVGRCTVENNFIKNSGIGIGSMGRNIISHNTLVENSVGVGCYWPPHSSIITDNLFINNEWAMNFISNSQPEVHGNNIDGNERGIRYEGGGRLINATLNWWGSASGPSGQGPGSGDTVGADVLFTPWLQEPNPNAGIH